MTFSKGKIVFVWDCLIGALILAVIAVFVNSSTLSLVAIGVCILGIVLGAMFLRCPACGRMLIRHMRPWKKECNCPGCHAKIKFM